MHYFGNWMLFYFGHKEILRSVKERCSMFNVGGVYLKEVHLYGEVECTSTDRSK